MRTPGGKKISEPAWKALQGTVLRSTAAETRLRDARGRYECAYERRIVSYAMHAHARLDAKAAGVILYYIPAIDMPACRMARSDFDDMRALPNLSTTSKLPGIMPIYVGMQMIGGPHAMSPASTETVHPSRCAGQDRGPGLHRPLEVPQEIAKGVHLVG